MAKRQRDGAVYEGTTEQRGEETKRFISSLKFSVPLAKLRAVKDRAPCPQCGKRRLYYCYDCLRVCHPESHPVPVALPLAVHVILHPGEHRSKSTSLAASTISPDMKILTYPEVPQGLDPQSTLVLYPSPQSVCLDEIEDLHKFKNVVFVDSTWQQSKAISRDERVTSFKHVKIPQRTSLFWRFQNNDPSYLATVEAIYYFLREYIVQTAKQAGKSEPLYNGEVDDLLLYYINQYIMVQQNYATPTDERPQHPGSVAVTPGEDKAFTTRHFQDYVLKGVVWDEIVDGPRSNARGGSDSTSLHK